MEGAETVLENPVVAAAAALEPLGPPPAAELRQPRPNTGGAAIVAEADTDTVSDATQQQQAPGGDEGDEDRVRQGHRADVEQVMSFASGGTGASRVAVTCFSCQRLLPDNWRQRAM